MKCIYLHLGSDDNNQCDMKTFLKLFLVKLKCCFIPCSKPSIELKKQTRIHLLLKSWFHLFYTTVQDLGNNLVWCAIRVSSPISYYYLKTERWWN